MGSLPVGLFPASRSLPGSILCNILLTICNPDPLVYQFVPFPMENLSGLSESLASHKLENCRSSLFLCQGI